MWMSRSPDTKRAITVGDTPASVAISSKILSQNRPQRGGQAHFAPKTPQNEPVPDGSGLGCVGRSFRRVILFNFSAQLLIGGNFVES